MPYRLVISIISRVQGSTYVAIADNPFPSGLGRTNERIARIQENYMNDATASWLESLERSLTQMKEYQVRGDATIEVDMCIF